MIGAAFAERSHCVFMKRVSSAMHFIKVTWFLFAELLLFLPAGVLVPFPQLLVCCLHMWREIVLASHVHSSSTGTVELGQRLNVQAVDFFKN